MIINLMSNEESRTVRAFKSLLNMIRTRCATQGVRSKDPRYHHVSVKIFKNDHMHDQDTMKRSKGQFSVIE